MAATAWFVAGIFATGAFWHFLSIKNLYGSPVSALGAVVFASLAIYFNRSSDNSSPQALHREQLGCFLSEA
jgi:hypothetical protein